MANRFVVHSIRSCNIPPPGERVYGSPAQNGWELTDPLATEGPHPRPAETATAADGTCFPILGWAGVVVVGLSCHGPC